MRKVMRKVGGKGVNNDTGIKERLRERLLEAVDDESLASIRQQLKGEGENPGSIDAVVSELRKKGLLAFKKNTAITKAQPVEEIVANLPWPVDVNGHVNATFVAGMRYEAMNVIRGIRLAQELSKMGVEQATPVIKMAQEMREAEGQAAKVIAAELAEATLEGNRDLKAAIGQMGNQMQVSGPNPFASMMAGVMQPVLGQVMQKVMGTFLVGQASPPQAGVSADPSQPSGGGKPETGAQAPSGTTPGIEEHGVDEWQE